MDLSAQWSYIEWVASERLANNITERHVSQYGTDIEVLGAAGELAARRFFHLPEELHTRFDQGADLHFKGIRIDVKATHRTRRLMHRNLQWPVGKQVKADVILLTAVNLREQSAILVGYALPRQILNAPVNHERDRVCHEIPVTHLNKAGRLLFAESIHDLYPRPQARQNRQQQYYRPGTYS